MVGLKYRKVNRNALAQKRLLQFRVLGFGLPHDGDVGVGVFQRVRKSLYEPFALDVSPDTV